MGRSHRVFRSKLGMMAGLALLAVCEPGKARGQQSIYLPDPTPRPPDLQREYSNDPAQRAREEPAARLLKPFVLLQRGAQGPDELVIGGRHRSSLD